jgi:F0F1-type ATP synthase assembly protein I
MLKDKRGNLFFKGRKFWKNFGSDEISKKIGNFNNQYMNALRDGDLEKADLIKNQIKYLDNVRYDLAVHSTGGFDVHGELLNREKYKAMNHEQYKYDYVTPKENESKLEKYSQAAAIIGISGGIIFLSPNLTGNVIADFSIKTTSFIGIGLLIVGLIAGFLLIKKGNKRRKQKIKKKVKITKSPTKKNIIN